MKSGTTTESGFQIMNIFSGNELSLQAINYGGFILKLEYVYLSVGIVTMLLNLAVTLHFVFRGGRGKNEGNSVHDEIITFRLSGAGGSGAGNQEREPGDETETLQ